MDFAKVLLTVVGFLNQRGVDHALVGAFALTTYGLSRATQDLDFAVPRQVQGELISYLESLGYETLYRSEGYSNHVHPLGPMGRIDCVYLDERTATEMFRSTTDQKAAGTKVRVPKPEHLAAMKILAMKNDPRRTLREMADLQHILTLPGIDTNEIRGYFERYGLEKRYDELQTFLTSD